ncbi:hypothetical protein, partial [Gemmiger sp.]|uniref:hypothetical protein n=1 Tax=Gemmiger sp. TaxID=2049027 RepID=UPI0025C610DD
CRTSLAVSALRIMRYCHNIIHYSASATGQIILFCYPSVMIFANNIRILIKIFFQLFCFTAGPQQKSARLLQGSVRALSCLFLCF